MGIIRLNPGGVFLSDGPGGEINGSLGSWLVVVRSDFSTGVTNNANVLACILGTDTTDFIISQPAAINATPYKLRFLYNLAAIILDGGSPIDINELPAGFYIQTLTINVSAAALTNGGDINNFLKLYFDPATTSAFLGLSDLGAPPLNTGAFANKTYTEDYGLTPKSLNSIFSDGFTIYGAPTTDNAAPELALLSAFVTGTYGIATYTWTLGQSGSDLHLSSPDGNPDLTTVDEVIFTYTNCDGVQLSVVINKLQFTTQTITLIVVPLLGICGTTIALQVRATIASTTYVIDLITVTTDTTSNCD